MRTAFLRTSTASGKAITNTLEMLEASRFELLAGLAQSELDLISEAITVEAYAGGEHIVQAGAKICGSICCRRGQASAVITLRSGREARLATFSRECPSAKWLSSNSAAQRRADTSSNASSGRRSPCAHLADNPRLKAVMMENLACDIGRKLRRTNETISTLKMTRTHRAVQGQL